MKRVHFENEPSSSNKITQVQLPPVQSYQPPPAPPAPPSASAPAPQPYDHSALMIQMHSQLILARATNFDVNCASEPIAATINAWTDDYAAALDTLALSAPSAGSSIVAVTYKPSDTRREVRYGTLVAYVSMIYNMLLADHAPFIDWRAHVQRLHDIPDVARPALFTLPYRVVLDHFPNLAHDNGVWSFGDQSTQQTQPRPAFCGLGYRLGFALPRSFPAYGLPGAAHALIVAMAATADVWLFTQETQRAIASIKDVFDLNPMWTVAFRSVADIVRKVAENNLEPLSRLFGRVDDLYLAIRAFSNVFRGVEAFTRGAHGTKPIRLAQPSGAVLRPLRGVRISQLIFPPDVEPATVATAMNCLRSCAMTSALGADVPPRDMIGISSCAPPALRDFENTVPASYLLAHVAPTPAQHAAEVPCMLMTICPELAWMRADDWCFCTMIAALMGPREGGVPRLVGHPLMIHPLATAAYMRHGPGRADVLGAVAFMYSSSVTAARAVRQSVHLAEASAGADLSEYVYNIGIPSVLRLVIAAIPEPMIMNYSRELCKLLLLLGAGVRVYCVPERTRKETVALMRRALQTVGSSPAEINDEIAALICAPEKASARLDGVPAIINAVAYYLFGGGSGDPNLGPSQRIESFMIMVREMVLDRAVFSKPEYACPLADIAEEKRALVAQTFARDSSPLMINPATRTAAVNKFAPPVLPREFAPEAAEALFRALAIIESRCYGLSAPARVAGALESAGSAGPAGSLEAVFPVFRVFADLQKPPDPAESINIIYHDELVLRMCGQWDDADSVPEFIRGLLHECEDTIEMFDHLHATIINAPTRWREKNAQDGMSIDAESEKFENLFSLGHYDNSIMDDWS